LKGAGAGLPFKEDVLMRVDLFDFDLPEENIALRPASPRDSARMLVVRPNESEPLSDHGVLDLPSFLRPGDALVFNDTKVIPAQLEGLRRRGEDVVTAVSLTLHMRVAPDRWKAFARPAKRLKPGDRIEFGHGLNTCLLGSLDATVEEKGEAGEVTLRFDLAGPALDEAILAVGHIPLPPYIASKRPKDEKDRTDYQTVYAREHGAVAAPTAGLHFTDRLFEALDALGVERHFVTLHVGAGTFLPMKVDDTDDHVMHEEIGQVSADVAERLNAVKARGGRIVCVGTTSLRLIESAAEENGEIRVWSGPTGIFITPGYRFRAVDILMTNFHLPKSTLFMLVSAFSGLETMRRAYAHAIETGYRFYSYGDSSLLFRDTPMIETL
jgi:S-adenosylmethionine:tRNA ribosyltransferase-isomerase